MRKTSIEILAKDCGGRLLGNHGGAAESIVIDSRQTGPGTLFVAVKGEKNDGHSFFRQALSAGCRSFLFSDEAAANALLKEAPDASVILAADTVSSLTAMAKAHIDRISPIKTGVTGSVGKTTTRTFAAGVLSERYNTVSTKKNLNTQLGLCLTSFLADESTEAIVYEMGMDRSGEIAEYVEWVRPSSAIITNVGISHLERLGTRDAIADAKLEITRRLKPGDPLIVNADSDYLSKDEIKSRAPGDYRIISVGFKEKSDYVIYALENRGADGILFSLCEEASGQTQDFRIPLLGVHNAINGALAAVNGLCFGVSLKESANALSKAGSYDRRLNVKNAGGIYVIDDSYNASPDSMAAAMAVLGSFDAKRRIAFLGDMLELGSRSDEGHISVGRAAAKNGIDLIIAAGKNAELYKEGAAGVKTLCFEDLGDAVSQLLSEAAPGDAVLVKGSNSTGVSRGAEALINKYEQKE